MGPAPLMVDNMMYNMMYRVMRGEDEMATMVRKQVYIEARQDELLKRIAKATGVSEAEIIRQAIDQYAAQAIAHERRLEAWKRQRAFLQQLLDQGPIEGGGRTWRRNDAYDV